MQSTPIQLLGHATFKVITPEGKVLIIDPWFSGNDFIPPAHREQPVIDLVLVTHGHDDHFDTDLPAIIQRTGAKVVANSICRWYLLEQGVHQQQIEPMNLGGTISVAGVKITMVNAFHLSHINVTESSMTHPPPAVGFVLQLSDETRVYFAGDTSIFGDMKIIGELYRPTIAVLPIGDRYTMGPFEAAHATRLLNVKHVIPFHYGTFSQLTGTPAELKAFTEGIEGLHIHVLQAGDFLDTADL